MSSIKALFRGNKRDVDMTQGSITRHLIMFALPLLAGNIFQQLYNTVDTWVVGNYVSNEAFSAVGSVGPAINMLIGLLIGFASGASVVISQHYGAKQYDKVHTAVHTTIVMTLVLAALFTVLGLALIPTALKMMNTPPEVIPESTTYLTIFFSGLIAMAIYNIGAGILRAVGDSQRPFYYLVVCAIINTVLDLVFVLAFDMGVAGVAWATVLAQFVSAILVLRELLTTTSCVKLVIRDLKIDFPMLGKIVKVGLPSAIQMALTSFSNVFVQSYINYFGSDCMSGWTAFSKIDQLVFLPMQSLALAATTFVGQNLGVNDVPRAKTGVKTALYMAFLTTLILGIPITIFAPQLTAFFNSKPEVIAYGSQILRWASPFYFVCCINQIYSGALRGAGNSRATMIFMLTSFVLFRQIYLYVVANFISNTFLPIGMSYPVGWALCSLITAIYYHKTPLDKMRVVDT